MRQTVGSSAKDYIFDQAGRVITQMSPGWARSELYASGLHVATYTNNTTYFDHSDWLGTVRARSSVSGASVETCTSLPFGDAQTCTGTDWSPLHFTGQDWDSESSLTHFMYRQLSTTEGRWISPDPAGMGAVNPGNPQTWNRYAYVMNNPLNAVDPLGLFQNDVNDFFLQQLNASNRSIDFSFNSWVDWNNRQTFGDRYNDLPGHNNNVASGMSRYLGSIPGYDVQGGELYWHAGFWTPNPEYDPDVPGSLIGTTTSILVDLGLASSSGGDSASLRPFSVSVYIPVALGHGGYTYTYTHISTKGQPTYNFSSHAATVSTFAAKAVVSGGPLTLFGRSTPSTADVISSWGWNFSIQALPWLGYQVNINSSGVVGGFTFGIPGASASYGWGSCTKVP